VRSALVELKATKVIVLGGTPAVSSGVTSEIDALPGVSVERIAGSDRYETARKVAARAIAAQGAAYDGTAFVATGQNFPDALGASPLSAARGWPIYLVGPTGLDRATTDAMRLAGVESTIILGSTDAVPEPVYRDLAQALSGEVLRLAGPDRYSTALAVADFGVAQAGLVWDRVAVATGSNFPDALAGGVLQGGCGSVMVLTPPTSLNGGVRTRLSALRMSVDEVRLLGAASAVSDAVRDQAIAALRP
jgi:putative cell wall-binding protein